MPLTIPKDVIYGFKSLIDMYRHTRPEKVRFINNKMQDTEVVSDRIGTFKIIAGRLSHAESCYAAVAWNIFGDDAQRAQGEPLGDVDHLMRAPDMVAYIDVQWV